MSATATIKVIAENLAPKAGALAPREGRQPAVEVDAAELRHWLEAFAGLPAHATEEANARLYLHTPARRLLVRYASGRLIMEENEDFSTATVDKIMANLSAVSGKAAPGESAADMEGAPPSASERRNIWLLAALLVVLAVALWWSTRREMPEGIVWMGAAESQVILIQVAGSYVGEDENLSINAATSTLVTTNLAGEEILRTTLRVGRRAGVPVFMAGNGVLLETPAAGELVAGASIYRRMGRTP